MQVEELLERENLRYKSAGKDVLVHCLNPEHADSSPSMRIDRLTGMFNCFSCSYSGNIFTHYKESVDTLGIRVIQLKKKIAEVLSDDMVLPLGCEPFNRSHRGISGETYKEFGAFIHDNYDGRIVFPIYDITGRLLAVLGRYAFSDATPKYLFDPPHVVLPLYPARPEVEKDAIVIVEGIFDVLNLWDKGLKNVICTFGKSMGETRKKEKKEIVLQKFLPLKIQGIKKVYILYDKGAESSEEKLANLLSPLFITEALKYPLFTEEKDAGNMNQEEVDALKEYINEKY